MPQDSNGKLDVVLVGGGHVHLEILRRLWRDPQPKLRFTLISLYDHHHYSGMVPGYLSGQYRDEDISFDLVGLAGKSSVRFLRARVTGLDPIRRTVQLEDEPPRPYGLVSFNVGSRTVGGRAPAVAQNSHQVKPISRVVQLRKSLVELVRAASRELHLNVVGAGSAGVEIACALDRVLRESRGRGRISLFDAGREILKDYPESFRQRSRTVLDRKGVQVYLESRVETVGPASLELRDGSSVPSDLTVWLTGPEAVPIFQGSGLDLSRDGFLLVNGSLQSISDPRVFAAGDCACLEEFPETPKAGVYAVRQAPVLWQSLLAAAAGRPGPAYRPQSQFLSILNTADGKALLHYKGFVSHSRWAWRLKNWIDRRFMARYQSLLEGGAGGTRRSSSALSGQLHA